MKPRKKRKMLILYIIKEFGKFRTAFGDQQKDATIAMKLKTEA